MSYRENTAPRFSNSNHRFKKRRTTGQQLNVEALENRCLLAGLIDGVVFEFVDELDPDDPAPVRTFSPEQAQSGAMVSFHGEDRQGKDGPLSRLGDDLTLLIHEYQLHLESGLDSPFLPTNEHLAVHGDRVLVNVISSGDADSLAADLTQLGMQVTASAENLVTGSLPIRSLDNLVSLESFAHARPTHGKFARAGIVDSDLSLDDDHFNLLPAPVGDLAEAQGDIALKSNIVREKLEINGTGITVGVISDSYNRDATFPVEPNNGATGAQADVLFGDLPDNVNVIAEESINVMVPGVDEGRAMLQIVHDVAPGANLAFATSGETPAEMAQNIRRLAEAGADIIVDDIGFPDEPFLLDGLIARAVDDVVAQGVSYFSAAGNEGTNSYDSEFVDSGLSGPLGGTYHDFAPGPRVDTFIQIHVPVGETLQAVLQWDEPWKTFGEFGSSSDLDFYLFGAEGKRLIDSSAIGNIDGDAMEIVEFVNDGRVDVDGLPGADETFNLAIEQFSGPAPELMKIMMFSGGTFDEYLTDSATAVGHPNAAGAFSVGATAFFFTPEYGVDRPIVNESSSLGGVPILFDKAGNRLDQPEIRQHPNATGPDYVNTTFFPFTTDAQGAVVPGDHPIDTDNPPTQAGQGGQGPQPGTNPVYGANEFPNFPGTSAAAPHIAGVAALMLEAAGGRGSLSPERVYRILENSAIDIQHRSLPLTGEDATGAVINTLPGPTFSIPAVPIENGEGYDFFSGHGLVDGFRAVTQSTSVAVGESSISGTKWHDRNGNGQRDAGEPGLSGWTIYVDSDGDGQLGDNEPFTVTGPGGSYRLNDLPAGNLTIREVVRSGWAQTFPSGSGAHRVNLGTDQDASGINFGNLLESGAVSGVVFDDTDGDGRQDSGELGVAGLLVHIDENNDGQVGIEEPQTFTGQGGHYSISDIVPGEVTVRLAAASGIVTSGSGSQVVAVQRGETTDDVDFGVRRIADYGDAPVSYGTLSADNGASHAFIPGFRLGANFDGESDGNPSPTAQGDDVDGSRDEDGVVFASGLQAGETAELVVSALQLNVSPGYFNGWMDFNGNGNWNDPGEQIFTNQRLADGNNRLFFDVPASATEGLTFARFRWGFELDLGPQGVSQGG